MGTSILDPHDSIAEKRRENENYTARTVRLLVGERCYEDAVNTLVYLEGLYRLSSTTVDSIFNLIVNADKYD